MKNLIVIFSSIIALNVNAQQDTLQKYYENGKAQFIYPTLDGKHHGICKRWYPTGQLWSEGNWISGKQDGLQTTYFDNGKIQMKAWFTDGEMTKSQLYHANGNKSLFSWISSQNSRSKYWYESGKKLMREKHKNGQQITCVSNISIEGASADNEYISCMCGNIPVFLKDSIYVDSLGNSVNLNYKFKVIEWFENGSLKSKTTSNKGKEKEWDENGRLIKDEKL